MQPRNCTPFGLNFLKCQGYASERVENIVGKVKDFKDPIAANWKGVCLQNTSKPYSYHLKIW